LNYKGEIADKIMFTVNKNQVVFCHLDKLSEWMTPAETCRVVYILSS